MFGYFDVDVVGVVVFGLVYFEELVDFGEYVGEVVGFVVVGGFDGIVVYWIGIL